MISHRSLMKAIPNMNLFGNDTAFKQLGCCQFDWDSQVRLTTISDGRKSVPRQSSPYLRPLLVEVDKCLELAMRQSFLIVIMFSNALRHIHSPRPHLMDVTATPSGLWKSILNKIEPADIGHGYVDDAVPPLSSP
jgi:hypothetical protein